MKRNFYLALVFVALAFSCSRKAEFGDASPVNRYGIKPLSAIQQDAEFVAFINAQLQFYDGIRHPDKIKAAMEDSRITEAEFRLLPAWYGYTNPVEFEKYFSTLRERSNYLDRTYGIRSLSREQQRQIFAEGFRLALGTKSVNGLAVAIEGPCEKERIRCVAAVAAEVATMHFSCAAADLTFFLGIACHTAATIYHIVQGNACNTEYQRCISNSNLD
jgi:hypothetical protein